MSNRSLTMNAPAAPTLLSRMRGMWAILASSPRDPELACAQFQAFSRQMPILYSTLMVNAVALAFTHRHSTPRLLSIAAPALLCLWGTSRLVFWLRAAGRPVLPEEALRQAQRTRRLAIGLGAGFTAWALSLYPYGDVAAKFHVAFFMSITVIACIYCLMHLRAAALRVTAIVIVPFTIFFCATGDPVFIAVALNFALVTIGMIYILFQNYETFSKLNLSQRELTRRQAETQRLSDENSRLASQDLLTGLPNRRMFLINLQHALDRARAEGRGCALALIDLDGFKGVNDTYGHAAGDRLLAEVGCRLSGVTDTSTFAARLGGDEFGVTMLAEQAEIDAGALGRRLSLLLKGPYLARDIVADVDGSVGVVTYDGDATTPGQLLERADFALYRAKETRTGQCIVFSRAHENVIDARRRLEQALHRADFTVEIWPAFQPVVDSVTSRVIGFEALARWSSPILGLVGPDLFIKAAERERLIGQITSVMLKKALREAASWPNDLRISCNLSAHDIINPDTVAELCAIITGSGVKPERLSIEITETAVLLDFDQAALALAALRQLGVHISLDDFGTGYSSLAHVHRLKPDSIKIDRSFVVDVQTSKTSRDIVRTIVTLCQNLELGCVVEGVETRAQERLLVSLGCRMMQGYLFGKPMQAGLVAPFLDAFGTGALVQAQAG